MNNIVKISKKQFKENLEKNTTSLNRFYNKKDLASNITALKDFDFSCLQFNDKRVVEKKQTNAIKFSNGSWLYLDSKNQTCYSFNNYLIMIDCYEDEYNKNDFYTTILIYKIMEG